MTVEYYLPQYTMKMTSRENNLSLSNVWAFNLSRD